MSNSYFDKSNILIYDKIYTMCEGEWKNIADFNKNKLLKQKNKIKIIFYHIEKTASSSLISLLYESFKDLFEPKRILDYELNNTLPNEHLIENYDVILDHVSFNNTLKENAIFNITCLREPVNRLIDHFHYIDSNRLGYNTLIEFKNNNLEAFKNYCYVIGNLQFLKLSGMYQELCGIELDFIKIINIDIKNIVYKNISQFDIVYIFEKLPENLTHTISKTYSDDFLDSLKTFCEYDYFIYNKCKDTTTNDLQYIINYFT